MTQADKTYLEELQRILDQGEFREDRTGVGTISTFGSQQRYDLTKGFPLLTSKKVYPRGVLAELLFFLQGRTDNTWLKDRNVHIWDEWEGEGGDLGPIYGYQWRNFGAPYNPNHPTGEGVDQILQILKDLRDNPWSRRHIISAWSPGQIQEMALPPCHTLVQFYVSPNDEGQPKYLSSQLYQRSKDVMLGAPFNIASYAAMTQLFAELVGLTPKEFVHTSGDAHLYVNHLEGAKEQLERGKVELPPAPKLVIHHPNDVDIEDPLLFDKYDVSDFEIQGYSPLPAIKLQVAV